MVSAEIMASGPGKKTRTGAAPAAAAWWAVLALGGLAGCTPPRRPPSAGCEPGTQVSCVCVGGEVGVQACNAEGTFAPCGCETPGLGTSTADPDASSSSSSSSGDPSGAPTDSGDASSTTDPASETTGPDACSPFATAVEGAPASWTEGAAVGLEAGTARCVAAGADHVCDYEELRIAAAAGGLDGLALGVTAWVHRTTTAEVDGVPSPPGTGGRCVNWTSASDRLADGEYLEITAAGIEFHLDADTFYDGVDPTHADPTAMPCAAVIRAIPCCDPC